MPRDKGGFGRTGSKHKKKATHDKHRQPKGSDENRPPSHSAVPDPPEETAVEALAAEMSDSCCVAADPPCEPSPAAPEQPHVLPDEPCEPGESDEPHDHRVLMQKRANPWTRREIQLDACGHDDHGPRWCRRPVYVSTIRRVRGSREAIDAIDAAADFERCSAELDSDEAAMEAYGCYLERLAELKAAFPNIVCCESFETGECAHGSPCECGWKQAPWPWIVHRPGGQFCDCHMS